MIGYLSIYVRIIGKKDTYYSSFYGDFGKPIYQADIDAILNSFRDIYAKNDEILSAGFCSKEEYEQKIQNQEVKSIKWNDTDKLNKIFENFDEVYNEHEDYVKHKDWRNASDSSSYMMGMAKCMQLLYSEEMGKTVYEEICTRYEKTIKTTNLN